jgi:hypothetical protein
VLSQENRMNVCMKNGASSDLLIRCCFDLGNSDCLEGVKPRILVRLQMNDVFEAEEGVVGVNL